MIPIQMKKNINTPKTIPNLQNVMSFSATGQLNSFLEEVFNNSHPKGLGPLYQTNFKGVA